MTPATAKSATTKQATTKRATTKRATGVTVVPTAPVGRPRDPDISTAILDATLELMSTVGYGGVSIAAVAQRAGVHKPAVYRRWPGKVELAVAAVEQISAPPRDPATGDTVADLVEMLVDAARRRGSNYPFALILRLRSEISLDQELSAAVDQHLVAPRRAIARTLIARGIARGDLRDDIDPDDVTDLLFGSIWARMSTGRDTLRRPDAERLVSTLVDGLRPRTPPTATAAQSGS
jgi:AcrR family transcriptional regulator